MKEANLSILLVEDDILTLRTNQRILSRFGGVVTAKSFEEAKALLDERGFDVAFYDLNLHGSLQGLDLIKIAEAKNLYSVVVSGESDGKVLEGAFQNGAKDYLLKPFSEEKLNQVLGRFFNNQKHLIFENIINENFITKSSKQVEELYKIKNLTISDRPIFIQGETGTGKRVVSHIIKKVVETNNFLELNCSQYTDELVASELFGHVKGSFTGATADKEGLLVKANGGVLFLDEIHNLSLKAQKTLLKAIEEKEFYPIGATRPVKSNFRLISATCENIHELIQGGKFREDLFARISTFQITLFPLKERPEDIELLFEYFISKHLIQIFINDEAKAILRKYSWPRNTREIEDLVENWVVDGKRLISPEVLPQHIRDNTPALSKFIPDVYLDLVEEYGMNDFLIYFKKELVLEMLKRNDGSIRKTANSVKASYSNLAGFLRQHKTMNLSEGK